MLSCFLVTRRVNFSFALYKLKEYTVLLTKEELPTCPVTTAARIIGSKRKLLMYAICHSALQVL